MKKRYPLILTTVIIVLALDQITKALILATIALHESREVIGGLFNLIHVRNPGAAFGLFASAPPWFRTVFFLAAKLGAIGLILLFLVKEKTMEASLSFSLSLIMAGSHDVQQGFQCHLGGWMNCNCLGRSSIRSILRDAHVLS